MNEAYVLKEYYSSDNLKSEVFIINNKREGIYKEYYETGEIKTTRTYISDNIHDKEITYDIDGFKRTESIYNNGELIHGIVFYNKDGQIICYFGDFNKN